MDSIPVSKGVLITGSEDLMLFISNVSSVFSVLVKAFKSKFVFSMGWKAFVVSIFAVSCRALMSKEGVDSASILVVAKVFKSILSLVVATLVSIIGSLVCKLFISTFVLISEVCIYNRFWRLKRS